MARYLGLLMIFMQSLNTEVFWQYRGMINQQPPLGTVNP
jgi:hypothetical protein